MTWCFKLQPQEEHLDVEDNNHDNHNESRMRATKRRRQCCFQTRVASSPLSVYSAGHHCCHRHRNHHRRRRRRLRRHHHHHNHPHCQSLWSWQKAGDIYLGDVWLSFVGKSVWTWDETGVNFNQGAACFPSKLLNTLTNQQPPRWFLFKVAFCFNKQPARFLF